MATQSIAVEIITVLESWVSFVATVTSVGSVKGEAAKRGWQPWRSPLLVIWWLLLTRRGRFEDGTGAVPWSLEAPRVVKFRFASVANGGEMKVLSAQKRRFRRCVKCEEDKNAEEKRQ